MEQGTRAGMLMVQEIVHGRWKAEVLRAVLLLGLADELADGTASAAELAGRLRADEEALGRLLTLAVEIGLFTRTADGTFGNNAASTLLRARVPGSLRTEAAHILATWARIAWDNLEYAVRHGTSGFGHATGKSVFQYLEEHAADADAFHAFQAHVTKRNVAALQAQGAFPATGTVVDVGGGNGAMLRQVLAEKTELRGVLYDLPQVVAAAQRMRVPEDLRVRLTYAVGDFFREVPQGGDVYVLSHVLHDWPDDRAAAILRRVAEGMGANAEVLVLENMLPDSDVGLIFGYLDVLMLAAWGGRERSLPAYRELLAAAELKISRTWHLDARSGLTAISARKATAN